MRANADYEQKEIKNWNEITKSITKQTMGMKPFPWNHLDVDIFNIVT